MTFSSQFYDTNKMDVWMSHEENMNQSSVWWGTVYADKNLTAIDNERENMQKNHHFEKRNKTNKIYTENTYTKLNQNAQLNTTTKK